MKAFSANHRKHPDVLSWQWGHPGAEVFATGVRGHWSILKNVAMNISREPGFDSIKGAAIHFSSNVKELLEYFRT